MELLKIVVLIALAVYFVADAMLLLNNRQFTVKRSRTWAIVISLLLIGLLLWGWFTGHPVGGEKSYGLDGREYFRAIVKVIRCSSVDNMTIYGAEFIGLAGFLENKIAEYAKNLELSDE